MEVGVDGRTWHSDGKSRHKKKALGVDGLRNLVQKRQVHEQNLVEIARGSVGVLYHTSSLGSLAVKSLNSVLQRWKISVGLIRQVSGTAFDRSCCCYYSVTIETSSVYLQGNCVNQT